MSAAATTIATPAARRPWPLSDINAGNVSAALTATFIYIFGPVPMYFAAMNGFGDAPVAMSSFFVVFATAGIGTALLALWYRRPLAVGWSLPALIYMTTLAPHHSIAEIAAGNLLAGAILIALALSGAAERLARVTPLPVVLGMFAGSSLAYCTGTFSVLDSEPIAVGVPLAGWVAGRMLGRSWLPPIMAAMLAGLAALAVTGGIHGASIEARLPALEPVGFAFTPAALFVVALPMVVLTLSVSNAQGYAVLAARGIETPYTTVTATTGVMTVFHALVGAPPASMQRMAIATLSADEAGPAASRYMAAVVASVGMVTIAAAAVSIDSIANAMPPAFIQALIGLTMLTIVFDAMKQSFASQAPFAAFVAFAVAGSDFMLLGIGGTFWAVVAGVAVMRLLEPPAPTAAR